jgi:hypothetical protein
MFSEIKIKTYANLLGLTSNELDQYVKRLASYFQTHKQLSKNIIINSLFILQQMHDEKNRTEAEKIKYKTKNLTVIKYSEKIVELYKGGMGTAKIVNHLKLNHRVTISKSALDRFITVNKIKRG